MVEIEGIKYYTKEEYKALTKNNKHSVPSWLTYTESEAEIMRKILNPNDNYYTETIFGWTHVTNKTQAMINCYINSDREHVVSDLESLGFRVNFQSVPDLRMRVDKKYIYIHIRAKQHKPLDKRINLKLDRREYTKSKLRKEINRG